MAAGIQIVERASRVLAEFADGRRCDDRRQ